MACWRQPDWINHFAGLSDGSVGSSLRLDFCLFNRASALTSAATISFLLMSKIVGLQIISRTAKEDSACDEGTALTITDVSADIAMTCAPGITRPESHAITAALKHRAMPPEKHSNARRTRFLPGIGGTGSSSKGLAARTICIANLLSSSSRLGGMESASFGTLPIGRETPTTRIRENGASAKYFVHANSKPSPLAVYITITSIPELTALLKDSRKHSERLDLPSVRK
jgi:hypothetical protein